MTKITQIKNLIKKDEGQAKTKDLVSLTIAELKLNNIEPHTINTYPLATQIIIAKYKNPSSTNDGIYGDTGSRMLSNATYGVRQIDTAKEVPLISFFGATKELTKFLNYEDNHPGIIILKKTIHNSTPFIETLEYTTNHTIAEQTKAITNIKKDGLTYIGDFSFINKVSLGHGWKYLKDQYSNTTTRQMLKSQLGQEGFELKNKILEQYRRLSIFSLALNEFTDKKNQEHKKILTVWNI